MYCTVQEAYNVPSFAAKRKKSDLNPLNTSRNLMQCAPSASAEPYDPFNGENGKGEQSMYNNMNPNTYANTNTYSNPNTPNTNTNTPNTPPPSSTIKEGFMCPSDDPSAPAPGSCINSGSNPFPKYANSPYASQANDYKHYCNYYNICSDTMPYSDSSIVEKFSPTQSNAKQPQPQSQAQAQAQCKPVQAPIYEIPVSDAAKKQYNAALSVAMQENNPSSTLPYTRPPPQMRAVDMSKVRGLYDDEIEAYMHVESGNGNGNASSQVPRVPMPQSQPISSYPQQPNTPSQFPKQNSVAAFDSADATPFSKALADFSAEKGRPMLHPEFGTKLKYNKNAASNSSNTKNSWQFVSDLILFISAGVLIILLCEMLFKIAITIGTRDTLNILEPYLAELAELRLKIAEVSKDRVSVLEV
jgi:hypothetical protein